MKILVPINLNTLNLLVMVFKFWKFGFIGSKCWSCDNFYIAQSHPTIKVLINGIWSDSLDLSYVGQPKWLSPQLDTNQEWE